MAYIGKLQLHQQANKNVTTTFSIVTQHAEDAALLWLQRQEAIHAPHFRLHHLARLDERLAAHLDGLCVAAEEGRAWPCDEAGELPGSLFATTVVALCAAPQRLDELLTRAQALPDTHTEVISAFGWVEASTLQGVVKTLLDAPEPFRVSVGISACAQHRVNPGATLTSALTSEDASLRASALQAAGVLGHSDLLAACLSHLQDADEGVRIEAANASVLLGDRQQALAALEDIATTSGPGQTHALDLALLAAPADRAHALLQRLSRDPAQLRQLIIGSGVAGDTRYLPWLLQQMEQPALARVAAEAFATICGLDLAELDLEGDEPKGFQAGPTDNPEDPDVAPDADENLPWPDLEKMQAWWKSHAQILGTEQSLFAGVPRTHECASGVLREGTQRQRELAALMLALHHHATPLFNVTAPAWRQKTLLMNNLPA